MESELYNLQNSLRGHVHALAVDIGSRTPSDPSSLPRAANYIRSVFERAGLSVTEQNYEYFGQQVTNVLATSSKRGWRFRLLCGRCSLRYRPRDSGGGRQCKCCRSDAGTGGPTTAK